MELWVRPKPRPPAHWQRDALAKVNPLEGFKKPESEFGAVVGGGGGLSWGAQCWDVIITPVVP
jgi:hypothetical protein